MFKPLAPWIVFNTESNPEGGGTPPAQDTKPVLDGETFDFPLATPTSSMTPAQVAEYWRHEAKKAHKESSGYKKLGTVSDVQTKITAADNAAQAALSDQERAVHTAREEGKTAGFAEARDKFAPAAVEGLLIASARAAGETLDDARTRVQAALAFVDVQKFITDDGALDATKVETFAQTLGTGAGGGEPQPVSDPLHQVLGSSNTHQQASAGSVDAYEAQVLERLNPKQ